MHYKTMSRFCTTACFCQPISHAAAHKRSTPPQGRTLLGSGIDSQKLSSSGDVLLCLARLRAGKLVGKSFAGPAYALTLVSAPKHAFSSSLMLQLPFVQCPRFRNIPLASCSARMSPGLSDNVGICLQVVQDFVAGFAHVFQHGLKICLESVQLLRQLFQRRHKAF